MGSCGLMPHALQGCWKRVAQGLALDQLSVNVRPSPVYVLSCVLT